MVEVLTQRFDIFTANKYRSLKKPCRSTATLHWWAAGHHGHLPPMTKAVKPYLHTLNHSLSQMCEGGKSFTARSRFPVYYSIGMHAEIMKYSDQPNVNISDGMMSWYTNVCILKKHYMSASSSTISWKKRYRYWHLAKMRCKITEKNNVLQPYCSIAVVKLWHLQRLSLCIVGLWLHQLPLVLESELPESCLKVFRNQNISFFSPPFSPNSI